MVVDLVPGSIWFYRISRNMFARNRNDRNSITTDILSHEHLLLMTQFTCVIYLLKTTGFQAQSHVFLVHGRTTSSSPMAGLFVDIAITYALVSVTFPRHPPPVIGLRYLTYHLHQTLLSKCPGVSSSFTSKRSSATFNSHPCKTRLPSRTHVGALLLCRVFSIYRGRKCNDSLFTEQYKNFFFIFYFLFFKGKPHNLI